MWEAGRDSGQVSWQLTETSRQGQREAGSNQWMVENDLTLMNAM